MVTGDYSRMRAAQADRERAVDVLKAAFAEGRLDKDEFAERVALAYRSRTYAELAALTDDLPVGPLGALAQPPAAQIAPFATLWPAIPEEPPTSRMAGVALALAAIAPLTAGLTGPAALILAFWAVADITAGRRSGAFWVVLALLFGAVGTGLFISDWGHITSLMR